MSTASMPALRLDLVPHRLGPRLGAEDADLQAGRARIDPLARELLDQHLHVRGRDHDDLRLQVGDQLDLLLGLPARHRDHGAAGALGAVVRAEAAGEEAVAVGDVDHVARPAAGGADRARDEVGPGVDVAQRVADDGRLAGRSRRRVDAGDALLRHGEQAERVVVAQVALDGEREARQVGERAAVVRDARPSRRRPAGSAARCRRRASGSSAGARAAAPAARRGWRARSARARRATERLTVMGSPSRPCRRCADRHDGAPLERRRAAAHEGDAGAVLVA